MTVSHEQIKKIAKNLSKIPITDEKIIGDIEGILKYVDMLQEIDTT
jgi:Asp-tRNA(Asn)/Glu-tRNA(Gln) amidotransferase C subunit